MACFQSWLFNMLWRRNYLSQNFNLGGLNCKSGSDGKCVNLTNFSFWLNSDLLPKATSRLLQKRSPYKNGACYAHLGE